VNTNPEAIVPEAPVPVRVTIVASDILRIAIGDRLPGAASSYLAPHPPLAAAASVAHLTAGTIVAAHEGTALLFSAASGRPFIRANTRKIHNGDREADVIDAAGLA
jgi:hypothetical protein